MSDPAEYLAAALASPFELDDTLNSFGARMGGAHRKLLELHRKMTCPTHAVFSAEGRFICTSKEPTGSYDVCGHCIDGYQENLDWPCPTVEILARAYGWEA